MAMMKKHGKQIIEANMVQTIARASILLRKCMKIADAAAVAAARQQPR
jgi:hypothetical protein